MWMERDKILPGLWHYTTDEIIASRIMSYMKKLEADASQMTNGMEDIHQPALQCTHPKWVEGCSETGDFQ